MHSPKDKIFAQCTAGVFGGMMLGIAGFINLTNYGGNYGCAAWIDNLFGTRGYESCGSFGALSGVLLGSILGILIITKIKRSADQYKKIGIRMAFATIILPLLYAVIIFWPPFVRSENSGNLLEDYDFLIAIPITIIFILLSIVPSGLITAALQWREIFKQKK